MCLQCVLVWGVRQIVDQWLLTEFFPVKRRVWRFDRPSSRRASRRGGRSGARAPDWRRRRSSACRCVSCAARRRSRSPPLPRATAAPALPARPPSRLHRHAPSTVSTRAFSNRDSRVRPPQAGHGPGAERSFPHASSSPCRIASIASASSRLRSSSDSSTVRVAMAGLLPLAWSSSRQECETPPWLPTRPPPTVPGTACVSGH